MFGLGSGLMAAVEGTGVDVTSAIGGVADSMLGQIGPIVGKAVPVVGAVMGVYFGFKIFKRITGARS